MENKAANGQENHRPGNIIKSTSYMMAVPREPSDVLDRDQVLAKLLTAADFTAKGIEIEEETGNAVFTAAYHEQEFPVKIHVEDYEIPKLFTINHNFTEENIRIMEESELGLLVELDFGQDPLEAFHLQLKILDCLVPDMAGVIDFSAEKILSSVWVSMAAQSKVPPAPSYLFSVQAVSDENGKVWMHTHGLNRCGFVELEILESDTDNYREHAVVLEAMASQAICEGAMPDEREAVYLASLPNGNAIVAAWLYWKDALVYYKSDILGGYEDRADGHDGETGVIYVFPSPEDYEQSHMIPVSELPGDFFDNPLMMISDGETYRMRALARERVIYLKLGLQRPGAVAIVKMRLDVDEDKKEEAGTENEHIWFEVLKLYDDRMDLKLTQEPYYVDGLHEGSEMTLEMDRLTDWIVYTEEMSITPDSAYLLIQ